jgi:transposase
MLCEEDGLAVSPRLRMLIEGIREEWQGLDQRIAAFDDEFAARAKTDEAARRPATIPGIGVLNATALASAIGVGETFARGRDLAAWLSLVPRQITTGGKPRLVGITEQGNCYFRKLLIHGARAVLPTLSKSETPLGAWLRALLARVHKNAAVAPWQISSPGSSGPCCGVKRHSIGKNASDSVWREPMRKFSSKKIWQHPS